MTLHVELHVPDHERARKFYTTLGFTLVWEQKLVEGKGYLTFALGDGVLCCRSRDQTAGPHEFFGKIGTETNGLGRGAELVIGVDNLDEILQAAQSLDAVVSPLQRRPWGLMDFRVADPFGYYLRFTELHDVTAPTYGGRPV